MELINATRMVAGFTLGIDSAARERLVVVVKGTFQLPQAGDPFRLADQQVPLVRADVFFGQPGLSATRYESDYAPVKPRCDVLVHASAYAPGGRPIRHVRVGVSLGTWSKSFVVTGDREWEAGAAGIAAGPPRPFAEMPIGYDRAFGGTDVASDNPSEHGAYLLNPCGRGYHHLLRRDLVDGTPLPNTEEEGRPVTWVDGGYRPMAFGPIGRHWEPRCRLAGTYDDRWREDEAPFLPSDFDDRYYQSAAIDQQIDYPRGGESIELTHLTPDGHRAWDLPVFDAPIHFFLKAGGREDGHLVLDTITIEPDAGLCQLTWRSSRPMRRSLHEVSQVMVGKRSAAWWAERERVRFPIQLQPVPLAADADGPDAASVEGPS